MGFVDDIFSSLSGGQGSAMDPVGKYAHPDLPVIPERDLYKETADTLKAQVDLAPDIYAAESSEEFGQPAYARMQLGIQQEMMPALNAVSNQITSATRGADVADVERYGSQMSEAFKAANPELFAQLEAIEKRAAEAGPTEIERQMEAKALDRLKLGGNLTPEEAWRADQDIRGAYSERGRVQGNAAISSEILNRYGLRRAREDDAHALATGVNQMLRAGDDADRNFHLRAGQLRAGAGVDPSLAVLGRASTVSTPAAQGQTGRTGPEWFDPMSPYAADLYNTNFNATVDSQMGAYNSAIARQQANIQSGQSAGIAALAMFCWVARAAYGPGDARWLRFRWWLFTRSPEWLWSCYGRNGEVLAHGLERVPLLKPITRWLMNRAIHKETN